MPETTASFRFTRARAVEEPREDWGELESRPEVPFSVPSPELSSMWLRERFLESGEGKRLRRRRELELELEPEPELAHESAFMAEPGGLAESVEQRRRSLEASWTGRLGASSAARAASWVQRPVGVTESLPGPLSSLPLESRRVWGCRDGLDRSLR